MEPVPLPYPPYISALGKLLRLNPDSSGPDGEPLAIDQAVIGLAERWLKSLSGDSEVLRDQHPVQVLRYSLACCHESLRDRVSTTVYRLISRCEELYGPQPLDFFFGSDTDVTVYVEEDVFVVHAKKLSQSSTLFALIPRFRLIIGSHQLKLVDVPGGAVGFYYCLLWMYKGVPYNAPQRNVHPALFFPRNSADWQRSLECARYLNLPKFAAQLGGVVSLHSLRGSPNWGLCKTDVLAALEELARLFPDTVTPAQSIMLSRDNQYAFLVTDDAQSAGGT